MIEQDKLKEIIEDIFEIAKQHLVRDKELAPVVFFLGDEGIKAIVAIAIDLNEETQKDALADAIKKMCKETDAWGYLFLSAAWMVTRTEEKGVRDIKCVSDCDDKIEIINMAGEYMNKHIQGVVPFNRIKIDGEDGTQTEQIICGESKVDMDFEFLRGRFMDLL